MTIRIRAAIAALIALAYIALGQPETPVKPVTVCEVLNALPKYSGKDLAILGRLDCGSSLIDHPCVLAQDQCERPIKTGLYVWPNRVYIVDWEEGMPTPPSGNPRIDRAALIQQLSFLRKTTKFGFHKEPGFKMEGKTIQYADVEDEWGVAYGRVFSVPNLRRDNCGDEIGCGGFDGAPIALIINPSCLHRFTNNGDPIPQE